MGLFQLVGRALRLRCPVCGTGELCKGLFRMEERCPDCGMIAEREPGFFLGSIYANYGATAVLTPVLFAVLRFGTSLPRPVVLGITLSVAIIFPIWFFRYARSLWLAFDQFHDPRPATPSEKKK